MRADDRLREESRSPAVIAERSEAIILPRKEKKGWIASLRSQ